MSKLVRTPGKSMALMALYVIVGIPLVGFIWDVLNELLSLKVNGARLMIALPLAIVLFFYLKFLGAKLSETFQPPEAG